jgi:hypothetical protein
MNGGLNPIRKDRALHPALSDLIHNLSPALKNGAFLTG